MDFGRELQRLRTARGLSLRRLGQRVHYSHGYLHELEHGKRPSAEVAAVLDDALGADGQLIALAAAHGPGGAVGEASRIAPYGPGRPTAGPREGLSFVEAVQADVADLVRLDTRHGSDAVLPLALRVFSNARATLAGGTIGGGPGLATVAGQAGQVAAWIAYDADDQDLARRLLGESLMLTRAAGDHGTELFELSLVAMVDIYQRRSIAALRIADDVLNAVDGRVGALFHVRRARALAQLGQEHDAMHALDNARDAFDRSSSAAPAWTWWIDESELNGHRALCLADLGKWPESLPDFRAAMHLRGRDRARAHYNDIASLFEASVMSQEWAEAERLVPDLLDYAHRVDSSRTMRILLRATDHISALPATSTLADAARQLRSAEPPDPDAAQDDA